MKETILQEAHKESQNNKTDIKESGICGCFHCLGVFPPGDVREWSDEAEPTAKCPCCGTSSVMGSASGYPVAEQKFLKVMQQRFFAKDAGG